MAVTVNDRYIRAVATSGQTVFTYDFPISENANIVILNIDSAGTVTTLTYAVDYTLTGVGTSSGTYVLTSGATSGDIYIAYGNTPYARTSDFAGKTEVTTAAINNQYDDLEKQIQQLRRDALRAISAPISDNAASIDFTLDAAADRGGKYMKFSSDGYSIEMDGGTGGSASAGGSNGQIQYNNAGALGGDTSTTDGAGNINVTTINIGSTTAITGFIDDDGMTTASATTVASSESIKAYVDSNTGGDVAGPASSTDNAVARYDGASGKIVQDSGVLISDTDVVSGITQLNVDNIRIDGNTISSTDTNGNVTVTPNGTGVFDLGNSTEAMQMPSGTTAQRPSSPVAGYVRFNTTTSTLETWDGSQWITQSGGSGDVTGPGSSTDNAVVRFDGTGGTLLQNSGVLISDANAVSGLASLNINSTTTVDGVIDDDTMATASATTLATSESIVAYQKYILLSSNDFSAQSSLEFTGLTSSYFKYIFIFDYITTSADGVGIRARVSSNGGSSYDSGASDYWYVVRQVDSGGTQTFSSNAATTFMSVITNLGNDTNEFGNVIVELINPTLTSGYTTILTKGTFRDPSAGLNGHDGWGQRFSNSTDAIQFLTSSGTFSGKVRMYGVKAS